MIFFILCIIDNFISICECPKNWIPKSVVEHSIKNIREQVGDSKVICALSGGVDSSVVAILLDRAIGKQLTCIFVDNGLMRKEEPERIRKVFEGKFANSGGTSRQGRILAGCPPSGNGKKSSQVVNGRCTRAVG